MITSFNLVFLYIITNLYFISSYLYHDYSYFEINQYLENIKGSFANLSYANELYNIELARFDKLSCSPYVARITDIKTLSDDYLRPQLLISGEIHGDERVGPGASLVVSQLLVWSAECLILQLANSCKELDKYEDLTYSQKIWLAHLAIRRDTYIIPTANCLGYINRERNDGLVDPNRDFPYKRNDKFCMQSTTSKIFQALMTSNIIQIVVTFHGGMVAIGYEWGSQNHIRPMDACPDDIAHSDIAKKMKYFAGKFSNEKLYPVGRINSIIYPVYGGMEDWLYAAGWDLQQLTTCVSTNEYQNNQRKSQFQLNNNRINNKQFAVNQNKINNSKHQSRSNNLRGFTIQPNQLLNMKEKNLNQRGLLSSDNKNNKINKDDNIISENRALVFLIETSDQKTPSLKSLGGSSHILHSKNEEENGHIPRNVRLSLYAIDMVQPYVCISNLRYIRHDSKEKNNESIPSNSLSRQISTSTIVSIDVQDNEKSLIASDLNSINTSHPHNTKVIDNSIMGTKYLKNFTNNIINDNTSITMISNNETLSSHPIHPSQQQQQQYQPRYLKDVDTNKYLIQKANSSLELEWYIGGATTVDCTFLAWHSVDKLGKNLKKNKYVTRDWTKYLTAFDSFDLTNGFLDICSKYKDADTIPSYPYKILPNSDTSTETKGLTSTLSFPIIASPIYSGMSRWETNNNNNNNNNNNSTIPTKDQNKYRSSKLKPSQYEKSDPMNPKSSFISSNIKPMYYQTLLSSDPSSSSSGTDKDKKTVLSLPAGKYWLIAWTMTDQNYAKANQGYPSNLQPQSHLVNIRTNPHWYRKVNNRISKGRIFWPSDPIEVNVLQNGDYYVKSITYHCAWWDIKEINDLNQPTDDHSILRNHPDIRNSISSTTGNKIVRNPRNLPNHLGNRANLSINEETSLKYILDHSVHLLSSNSDQLHSAQTLYAITCALLLLTIIVCGFYMCSQQWRHKHRTYASLVKNKYVNFSNFAYLSRK